MLEQRFFGAHFVNKLANFNVNFGYGSTNMTKKQAFKNISYQMITTFNKTPATQFKMH